MSFVFKAERKMEFTDNENNVILGPGSYVGHKEYKTKPQV